MARGYTAEYIEWLEDNNFSTEDENLIQKTATGRMVIWFILSCIPTVGIFFMPLLMNAWTYRKIIKQKSFEPRPGLLYSLFAVAMYVTFILIIPWILWTIVKRGRLGCGIRGLIRKGKIGNGNRTYTTTEDSYTEGSYAAAVQSQKRSFPWSILVLVIVVIIAAFVVILFTERNEPAQNASISLPNYQGLQIDAVTEDLEARGITYTITYVTDSDWEPGTVIQQTPVPGTVLDAVASVELVVITDKVQVPDFSTAATVDEINAMAQQYGITVKLIYTDAAAGLTFDSIPEGMVIEQAYADYAAGTEVSPGTEITVTVCLKAQYTLTGEWYHADYTYGSLTLTRYSFREDGTFSYYYMGYMPVDYETEVYTYGTYWNGAMGADSYDGTYQVSGQNVTLSYDFWNWETESNDHANRTMDFTIHDGVLTLGYAEQGIYTDYLPGTQPDRDEPMPFSINGSWYAFGTPESTEFGNQRLSVYVFYLFAGGEFSSYHYDYLNDGSGWYFPGAGSKFVGTYTFDNSELALSYTAKLSDVYNNDGDIIGTESVPVDYYHTIMLTVVGGVVTEAACYTLFLNSFYQYDPSPYVNVDIMGKPLNHANQLYP